MDARMLELLVLGLTSALLCGVAIAAQHGLATNDALGNSSGREDNTCTQKQFA
jgi:hypothetical protein